MTQPLTTDLLSQASRGWKFREQGLLVDGDAFDLDSFPFLWELYDERFPRVVVRKAAQLGLTMWAMLTVIEGMLDLYNRGVLYVFPSDDEVNDFSKSRFERLMRENLQYQQHVSSTDRTTLKRIGESMLYFRGMRSRTKLLSIPVDLIVFDEFNDMEPEMVELAMQRLSGSKLQHWIKLGHPTLPDYGIDLEWERSDQRLWHIKCEHCGDWTCLEQEFPDCFVLMDSEKPEGEAYRACHKCRKQIHVVNGDWVPTYKDRDIRGYWASNLLSPTMPPGEILRKYNEVTATGRGVRAFYNLTLGQPYADFDDLLSTSQVFGLCNNDQRPEARHPGPCFGGVDPGAHFLHGCFGIRPYGETKQILQFFTVKTFDELYDLGQAMNCQLCVIDGMAEKRAVRAFTKRVPWAWSCQYTHTKKDYVWDNRTKTVTVNRTESLDASHHGMVHSSIKFPRATNFFRKEVAPQLTNLARSISEDPKTGARTPSWIVRGKKNDHFRHALNYAIIASDRTSLATVAAKRRKRSLFGYDMPSATAWQGL